MIVSEIVQRLPTLCAELGTKSVAVEQKTPERSTNAPHKAHQRRFYNPASIRGKADDPSRSDTFTTQRPLQAGH